MRQEVAWLIKSFESSHFFFVRALYLTSCQKVPKFAARGHSTIKFVSWTCSKQGAWEGQLLMLRVGQNRTTLAHSSRQTDKSTQLGAPKLGWPSLVVILAWPSWSEERQELRTTRFDLKTLSSNGPWTRCRFARLVTCSPRWARSTSHPRRQRQQVTSQKPCFFRAPFQLSLEWKSDHED